MPNRLAGGARVPSDRTIAVVPERRVSGEFGADASLVAPVGAPIRAPISGIVTRVGQAYAGEPELQFVEITSPTTRYSARVFYVGSSRAPGAQVTAGDMYAECTQAVASAGIYLIAATQRGVHHAFGDKGGDASANIGREIVLMSGDDQEAGRVTGNYKLPPLRHRGECYARLGDD